MFFSFTTILSSFALGLLVQIEGAALQDIGLTNTSKSSEARDNFLRPLDLNKRATASELFSFRDVGEKGGCSTTQISTIDDWLKESVLLHNAALSAMNFGSVPADPMHLVWIMGVTFDKGTVTNPTQWKAIEDRLAAVSSFFAGGSLPSAATGDAAPYIFCDDKFAEYTPWNQPAKDSQGNTIPDPDANDQLLTVQDLFPSQVSGRLPFWISLFNGYDFDANGYENLCDLTGLSAVTSFVPASIKTTDENIKTGNVVRHFTLCPPAWSRKAPMTHSVATLASVIAYDGYPTSGAKTGLDTFAPMSATLYHELFHLTDTTDKPTGDLMKSLKEIYDDDLNSAAPKNPESFVMFALASYINRNPPTAPSGSTAKPAVVFLGGLPKALN